MKNYLKNLSDEQLKNMIFLNARAIGRSTALMMLAEESIRRTIFNKH
jgi:hypothetical protein